MEIEAKNVALKKGIKKPSSDVLELFDVERVQPVNVVNESAIEKRKLDLNRRGRTTEILPSPRAEKARCRIPPNGHEKISVLETLHDFSSAGRREDDPKTLCLPALIPLPKLPRPVQAKSKCPSLILNNSQNTGHEVWVNTHI
jgi:hypothetical protein